MSSGATKKRETFVGVNLDTKEVVAVALFADMIRDAYVLRGEVDSEGQIVLDPDDSYNGREATEVCLASQGCGLGWRFVVAGDEDEPRREFLVHLNIQVSAETTTSTEEIVREVEGALSVGIDAEQTPALAVAVVEVALAEEI